MFDHFSRLGGMILHPRATLARVIVDREGGLLELLPWVAIVGVVLDPQRAGQAVLIMRTGPLDGVMALLSVIGTRMTPALGGALVGACLLYLLELVVRRAPEDERYGFDAALDACAFCLVPYLLLAALGQALAVLGADFWWMPQYPVRGPWIERALEIGVAYGWSIVLYVLAAVRYSRR